MQVLQVLKTSAVSFACTLLLNVIVIYHAGVLHADDDLQPCPNILSCWLLNKLAL